MSSREPRRPPDDDRGSDVGRRDRPGVGRAYSRSLGEAGPYLFIGIQIAASMLVFVIGGYLADEWLGTSPWLLLLGAGLGMAAVVATMIKAIRELDRRQRLQRDSRR